ncbi:uncharacterized protein BBA_09200 [Beauveria bassiana ARSEF 2860]|uniref:Uncharacterized protein n=1 Tax=Beauveria bassiana (strain ARSEF 2860) TaxID=655819 RepID=J5J5L2_BEAB2|nr:uncharacterized protein BBA_09200 [Beauveria bassiana ARSEF 2860]EJP61863.1 hypothetical protein BBA_09200 [Beauveria bassiana ARSEF 2860]
MPVPLLVAISRGSSAGALRGIAEVDASGAFTGASLPPTPRIFFGFVSAKRQTAVSVGILGGSGFRKPASGFAARDRDVPWRL